jgi:hypothetical protein
MTRNPTLSTWVVHTTYTQLDTSQLSLFERHTFGKKHYKLMCVGTWVKICFQIKFNK